MTDRVEVTRHDYGPDPSQYAVLTRPEGDKAMPVFAVIHGGYWKDNQTRESYPTHYLVDHLVARGDVAVWDIEFRRMQADGENTAAPWPAILDDVAIAMDALRALADPNRLDLSRIVLSGHSAGAHLAAWAACRSRIDRSSVLWRADPLRPRHLLLMAGILDLQKPEDIEQPIQIARMIGGGPDLYPDRYAASRPTLLGMPQDMRGTIVHGTDDPVVDLAQSVRFGDRHPGQFNLVQDAQADHFGVLFDRSGPTKSLTKTIETIVDQVL